MREPVGARGRERAKARELTFGEMNFGEMTFERATTSCKASTCWGCPWRLCVCERERETVRQCVCVCERERETVRQ